MSIDDRPLWEPLPADVANARLAAFRQELLTRGVVPPDVTDAHALQRWSVEHLEAFWAEVWRAAQIMADGPGPADAPWDTVLANGDVMRPPHVADGLWEGPRWFVGTRLNFAEHLLRRRDDGNTVRNSASASPSWPGGWRNARRRCVHRASALVTGWSGGCPICRKR